MKHRLFRSALSFLFLLPLLASAQLMPDSAAVERMRADVRYLASDELAGREAGTPGERLAAEHIAAEFARLGLKPKGNMGSFLQEFTFHASPVLGPDNTMQLGRKRVAYSDGFHPLPFSAAGAARGKVLKLGHGIHAPELGHDDFKDIATLQDRIVALSISSPDGIHPHSKYTAHHDLQGRVRKAAELGAAAVLFYNDDPAATPPEAELRSKVQACPIPVVFLIGNEELLVDGNPCVINVDIRREQRTGYNVVGLVDNGAGTATVTGAHYDHLGWGDEGSRHRGEPAIHYGADDNASGTAVLLQLARDIKEMGNVSGSDHLFIAFSGEEKGLYGSNYWTKNPIVPIGQLNYMLNLDMVGRLDSAGSIGINGVGTSPSWGVVDSVKAGGLTIRTTLGGIGSSDHTSFYLQGVPAIHFFTGTHPDYHKPGDTWEKLNYEGMLRVTRFIEELMVRLDGRGKLEFTKTEEENAAATPRFKVTLGVIPDYMHDGRGMRIDGITEGRPAANAGLRAGDVVVRIGAADVHDMTGYMKALGQFNKGDTAKVTVLREGQEVTMDVTF